MFLVRDVHWLWGEGIKREYERDYNSPEKNPSTESAPADFGRRSTEQAPASPVKERGAESVKQIIAPHIYKEKVQSPSTESSSADFGASSTESKIDNLPNGVVHAITINPKNTDFYEIYDDFAKRSFQFFGVKPEDLTAELKKRIDERIDKEFRRQSTAMEGMVKDLKKGSTELPRPKNINGPGIYREKDFVAPNDSFTVSTSAKIAVEELTEDEYRRARLSLDQERNQKLDWLGFGLGFMAALFLTMIVVLSAKL